MIAPHACCLTRAATRTPRSAASAAAGPSRNAFASATWCTSSFVGSIRMSRIASKVSSVCW